MKRFYFEKIFIVLLFVFSSILVFSQNQTFVPKFEVTTYDYKNFPTVPDYVGPSEKIELTKDAILKVGSLPDLKPNYIGKYEILKFDITYSKMGTSINLTCVGSGFSPEARRALESPSIFIDNILAKDLKTSKVLHLQPLKIKIKEVANTK